MTTTLTPPFKIRNVQDTRQFVEDGDRWVPIPGSGDPRECDRCNRIHEIHAEVTDAAGQYAVVGIGCMNATTAEARSLSGKATRAARKAAKEQALAAARSEFDSHAAVIAALTFPAEQVVQQAAADFKAAEVEFELDGIKVWGLPGYDTTERMGCLEGSWRRHRFIERVGGTDAYNALCRRAGTYYS